MQIKLYTDGACSGNPGPGGWAALLPAFDDASTVIRELMVSGGEPDTRNNRMEIKAVIEGLKALTRGSQLTIVTDSEYVMKTMTENWKRKKNQDLWADLDKAIASHTVTWEWTRGHAGDKYNETVDQRTRAEAAKCEEVRQKKVLTII
jgi:ribonuclease HI